MTATFLSHRIAKQRTPTACLASRLQIASYPAVFCVNHILQMLLETEVRVVSKLIGIGIKSQHVHVQVLDGVFVAGTIEMTPHIATPQGNPSVGALLFRSL